jgi:hypothetical protein
MKPKTLVTEYTTLFGIYLLTWGIVFLSTGNLWGEITLDVNLADTYIVTKIASIIPIFLLAATIVYLVKEGRQGYKRKIPNLIMIVINFALIIDLYLIVQIINRIPGGTREGRPRFYSRPNTLDTHFNFIPLAQHTIPIIAIIFMLILVITSILTGKNWSFTQNEQQTS